MYEALERYRWLIVAALAVPLLVGLGFLLNDRLSGPQPLEIDLEDMPGREARVYISGAVQRPGVYTVTEGDRWIDVLEKAGGPTTEADVEGANLATRVRDEDHIHIPRLGATTGAVAGQTAVGDKIDINTASEALLDTLPGIGEVRAGRIVESRQIQPFASTQELVERGVIPRSVYEDIADLVTVGP
ncbi:MAG: helix-hairpin-helix domain-containing protein [Dehalococcoidia bacterium]